MPCRRCEQLETLQGNGPGTHAVVSLFSFGEQVKAGSRYFTARCCRAMQSYAQLL